MGMENILSDSYRIILKFTLINESKINVSSRPTLKWNETNDNFPTFFTGLPKNLFGKMAIINYTLFLAYSVQVLFLKVSYSYRKWLINNGLKKVKLFPVDFMYV